MQSSWLNKDKFHLVKNFGITFLLIHTTAMTITAFTQKKKKKNTSNCKAGLGGISFNPGAQ